ncbi:MAG: mechanosensitive ion channel [Bacteroidales bacterium]|nr:mechanosensitive ion channel [Bacteroidales bacterium]
MNWFNNISFSEMMIIIIIGFAIFFLFRVLARFLPWWVKEERKQKTLFTQLPLIENVVWIVFSLAVIVRLTMSNPIVTLFVVILLIGLSWSFVRNFVLGTLFRLQKGDMVGQQIKVDGFSGEIMHMKQTQLEIRLESGETVLYPYSKLSDKVVYMSAGMKHHKDCNFSFTITIPENIEETKTALNKYVLNIPWVDSDMPVKITSEDTTAGTVIIKVSAFTFHEKFISKIEAQMKTSEVIGGKKSLSQKEKPIMGV